MIDVVEAQPRDFVDAASIGLLRERERMLATITDALPVLVAYVDSTGRYQFASASYQRWFGYGRDAVVGRRLVEVLGEAAYATIQPHMERALAGEPAHFEAEVPYRDGG